MIFQKVRLGNNSVLTFPATLPSLNILFVFANLQAKNHTLFLFSLVIDEAEQIFFSPMYWVFNTFVICLCFLKLVVLNH